MGGVANSDFAIRSESESRIMATSNIVSQGGLGATVDRASNESGFPNSGGFLSALVLMVFPNILDSMLDFKTPQ
ncbi:MAG: hypothetical protein CM1200mP40_30400 [Gammaproteobacteria bacterium]|nr:MAG: hypothetical protein CM1200mP40_30400 [Gammaproteobacteria bacterium]